MNLRTGIGKVSHPEKQTNDTCWTKNSWPTGWRDWDAYLYWMERDTVKKDVMAQIGSCIFRCICKYVCTFKKYRVRKNQKSLTRTEWLLFRGAINALKDSGIEPPTYQEFVDVHVQAMTTPQGHMWGAHGGSNFLPWHREYLMEFENRLRLFNPLVTIPYWDWAKDPLPAELSDPQDLANWGITRNNPIG